jgi:general secretion pathway protein K
LRYLSGVPTSDEKGSALIITLLLVTILVGLTAEFAYEVFVDSSAFSNWANAQKASYIARSGQNIAARLIDEVNKETYTAEPYVLLPVPPVFESGIELSVKIEDENRNFNINSIIYPNGRTNDRALASLQKLLEYLNINPDFALFVADWIDPDSEPRAVGSEEETANRPLWSTEELALIRGIDNEGVKKLKPFVTVFGNGLVNINTADAAVLQCLSKDMTGDMAQRIIDYRETEPFHDKNHIVRVAGLEAIGISILDRITVKSSTFRVTSEAVVNGIPRTIESVTDASRVVHYWREG